MQQLIDACLNEVVVCSQLLGASRIVAVVSVDHFTRFALYAVHIRFRHLSGGLGGGSLCREFGGSCCDFCYCIGGIARFHSDHGYGLKHYRLLIELSLGASELRI